MTVETTINHRGIKSVRGSTSADIVGSGGLGKCDADPHSRSSSCWWSSASSRCSSASYSRPSTAPRSSRKLKCLSNLRQIGSVDQVYQNEWKGWHMPGYYGWTQASGGWPQSTPPAIPASGPRRWWFQTDPLLSPPGRGQAVQRPLSAIDGMPRC